MKESLLTLRRELEETTNILAPPFVKAAGQIQISLVNPQLWDHTGRKSYVKFLPHHRPDDDWRELGDLGAGTCRWIVATAREAARRMTDQVIDDDWGRVEPQRALTLLLVDEPEAHLHRLAQDDVAEWCASAVDHGASVMVATHSPSFLNLGRQDIQHLLVSMTGDRTYVDRLEEYASVLGEQPLLEDLGLSPVDLVSYLRGVLVVEGKHDRMVIDHFFGGRLARERIAVLPLHGIRNTDALIESEIMVKLGICIGVLFDAVGQKAWNAKKAEPWMRPEESALLRLRQTDIDGSWFATVPFELPDITCALPEEPIREEFPAAHFSGWDQVLKDWRASKHPSGFKEWLFPHMGLGGMEPARFIERVLERSDPSRHKPRQELTRAVEALLAELETPMSQPDFGER